MQLRSGKIIASGSIFENNENITLTFHRENNDIPDTSIAFRKWLISCIKKYSNSIQSFHGLTPEITTVVRSRMLCEMIHIISEHIDYVAATKWFDPIMDILPSRLQIIKNEITAFLNSENRNYTQHDRVFLGNVRADVVKLAVMLKNRQ
jgi:hypothetical protein